MTRIYGVHRSRASRIYWLAAELGIALDEVPVIQAYRLADPDAPGAPLHTRAPDYLCRVPIGSIPAMVDGDLVLTESLAITLYLAKKHGGPLAPQDLAEDARMTHWALFGATWIEPPALELMFTLNGGAAETEAGRAKIAAAATALARPLAVLDAHLAAEGQMVGGRFTVADINMAEIVRYATAQPGLVAGYPSVQAWYDACHAREGFRKMWARREAEPA